MSGSGFSPALAIVGPTASGKSALAVRISERFDAEIVNVDSVQVYRGFDIGTAKTPLDARRGIPHHLIDHVEPQRPYSAGEFARDARAVLQRLRQRQKLPVLVGGTGFYLDAVLNGLFPGPRRDANLRRRLQESAAKNRAGHLWRMLARLDPLAAQAIHPNDSPKIVRAIEVTLLGKRPMTDLWREAGERLEGYRVLLLGLDPPREALYARIGERARRMFGGGLVEEVRGLLRSGVSEQCWPFRALGYAQCLRYLDGKSDLDEAIAATAMHTRRYAKRQLTWLRGKQPGIRWLGEFGDSERAFEWAAGECASWLEIGCEASPDAQ